MCDCAWCKLSRRVRRTQKNGSRPQMRRLIDELMNRLADTGEDLSYHKAVLDGSWPSAVEQLEAALAVAKEKRAQSKT